MPSNQISTETWLLGVILVAATIFRFFGLDYSFSNDELSALSRLSYDSLGDLIQQGVRIDGHPAFVQVFLYLWTSIFPVNEISVRLPFVLFGIGSVLMAYLVSRAWFGKNTALLVAASMAGLQFFIMYSQLARPYSPGLFFTWLTAYYWTKILLNKGGKFYAIAGGLAMALAMYTHYFSFLQVLVMAIVGLFMVNPSNWKNYLIAAITTLVIWAPHLGITLYQFGLGGVGTWLGPPDSDYLWKFILFLFNDSVGILTFFILIALVGVAFSYPKINLNRWQIVCILLFLIPFSIGYYYSLFVNPVIQYSTLIFAAPAILMLVFSFVGSNLSKKVSTGLVLLIIVGTSYGTIVINRYYSTEGFGVFKELASKIKEWDTTYGVENVLKTANVNSPRYLQHYLERIDHPVDLAIHNVHSDSSRAALCELMNNHPGDYLSFAWSTHYVPLETYEWIRKEYPHLKEAENHFNSGVYLFSRHGKDERHPTYQFDFKTEGHTSTVSGFDESKLQSDSSGWYTRMTPEDEYSWNFSVSAQTLGIKGGELIVATAVVVSKSDEELTLVYEYQPSNGEKIWYGKDLTSGCVDHISKSHDIIVAQQFPDNISPEDQMIVYLWKRSDSPIEIRNLNISIFQNPVPQ